MSHYPYLIYFLILCLTLGINANGLSQSCKHNNKHTKVLRKYKKKNQTLIILEADTKHTKKSNVIGLISWEELKANPPSFEYHYYLDSTTLDNKLTTTLQSNPNQYKLLVFGGLWWCPDTRDILGKLLLHLERADFAGNDISFVGINRSKQGAKHLANIMNVSRVPTILVFKEGEEVGRIVEYGKTHNWESELAQLLTH